MRSLDLNFATAPFRNNTPYYLGYGLGVVALTVFTAYNSWAFFAYSQIKNELESDRAEKQARIDTLYQESARLQEQIKKKDLETINARATLTNGLLDRRRFSWTDLFNNLEEVQPYQVRLLSIIPRIGTKGILIDARAVSQDLQSFWNFQQNLQNDPKFRRVYPGGFTRNNDAGEYIFNIAFSYFPTGAPADVPGLTAAELAQAGIIVDAPGEKRSPETELEDGGEIQEPAPAAPSPPHPAPRPGAAPPASKPANPDQNARGANPSAQPAPVRGVPAPPGAFGAQATGQIPGAVSQAPPSPSPLAKVPKASPRAGVGADGGLRLRRVGEPKKPPPSDDDGGGGDESDEGEEP